MNTSQPPSATLAGVQFTCLLPSEIRSLSAKRITQATTFDTLLNPVPGGLYDASLGQFQDNNCATCGLKTPQCPGHCGHIELPVPCYHPTFLAQVLRLLRATCVYCHKLRMGRKNVQRYAAALKLVRVGLLVEAKEVENVAMRAAKKKVGKKDEDEDNDEDKDEELDSVLVAIESFVRKAVKQAKKEGRLETQMTEASNSARDQIVREFMLGIAAPGKCRNCQGISPKYRKDRFVKIFQKTLSDKEKQKNNTAGVTARDPILELAKLKKAEENKKRKREAIDEGVADMDGSTTEEEEEGEDVMSREASGEPEVLGGDPPDETTAAKKGSKPKREEEYVNPARVHALLRQLFEREQEVLNLVYGGRNVKKGEGVTADMFFIHNVLVPPNRYRPEARTGAGQIAEAQENDLYKAILTTCDTMSLIQRELSGQEMSARQRPRTYGDFENTWVNLQDAVNSLIDRDRAPLQGRAGQRNADGVKQKLEKKEGMFRKYMMGKRVNFAARTVISPDPNIETNEIGVPPVFAVKLTYPEPVTGHNVEDMQEAVKNGPFVWPGAVAIESEDGRVVNLERKNAEERVALANQLLAPSTNLTGLGARGTRPKKVHRHLNNGDIVIMNRQPTLHKPSMMCHRAKVLPGEKTLRMHYSNCNTYNADFDGDEMNMHFPQNEVARAEALSIADTDHQYLSGTAGNPLRGLIQDHVSMGVWLTVRDTFFERGEYMQLLYAAVRPENGHSSTGRVETVPPAVFKPKCLWTGKQVITSILKNVMPQGYQGLTMDGKSTTDASMWGAEGKDEGTVVVQDGYLCQGIMDKKQIGPSSGGFVNAVYEAYGHTVAGRLLSVLGRLLTRMLTTRAFSCGVEDLVFTQAGEAARREALSGAATVGVDVARKYVSLDERQDSGNRELRRRLEDVLREDSKQAGLDQLTNNATRALSSAVTSACLPSALIKPFPKNQMQAMTTSGAKGSKVNANQISCNLGQQVLEGRRVPVMVSGKTLPCFKPFETNVRAGGYIVDRFLTGVRPQEYYFHAMAGREGLIDTAVKTSRSGYLQRCLIKGMEGLRVEYDTSVRDISDGSLIQFLYGEDGLDVAKAKYLSDFKFSAENYLSLFNSFGGSADFKKIMSEDARDWNKEADKKFRKTGDLGVKDPALGKFNPSTHAGSTSERIFRAAKEYVDENPDRVIRDKKKDVEGKAGLTKKNFQSILDMRYLKSVVEAGEAVGVVAGQSVGEPSTQMTLNTFHLAGHSAKNVTLGIPRLREIVMTAAANIATPTMTLRMNEDVTVEDARKFAKGISRLSLAECIDKITVSEQLAGQGKAYAEARKYDVSIDFFPSTEYTKEYAITIEDVIATIEHRFLPTLQSMVRKEIKKRGEGAETLKQGIGKSAGRVEEESSRPQADREGGDDDSDGEGDDDATRDKAKNNRQQAGYEAQEDDEEGELKKRNQREADAEAGELHEDEGFQGSPRAPPDDDAESSDDDDDSDDEAHRRSAAQDRANRIRAERRTNDVTAFAFDDATGDKCTFSMEYSSSTAKILMLDLVERAARQALVQSVPGLAVCMVDEEASKKGGPASVVTAGVNLRAMWEYQSVLHPHHLYTNSVHDLLVTYGVEAARAGIVRELQGVFGGHGISVDARHLMLIADYMTRDGVYQAFSRNGYRSVPSPFMKMSFETTVGFLRDAVLAGEREELRGPSARIVAGVLGGMGTGGFDVLVDVGKGEEGEEGEVLGEGEEENDVEMGEGDNVERLASVISPATSASSPSKGLHTVNPDITRTLSDPRTMWLINTATLELNEFIDTSRAPPYIALSHCWGADEVSFKDFRKKRKCAGPGYDKIVRCCERATQRGIEWAWVDTCSAELSEAINSMFQIYRLARECYAHLADVDAASVPSELENGGNFYPLTDSRWFTRGWTLQELLAPRHLLFFDRDWTPIGHKAPNGEATALTEAIAARTGIPKEVLVWKGSGLSDHPIHQARMNVAQCLGWASGRRTTRAEDEAYCLLGIFNIQMSLLYGEGHMAFRRLLIEIIRQELGDSVFMCADRSRPRNRMSLLPETPQLMAPVANVKDVSTEYGALIKPRGQGFELTIPPHPQSVVFCYLSQRQLVVALGCVQTNGALEKAGDRLVLHLQYNVRCGHYYALPAVEGMTDGVVRSPFIYRPVQAAGAVYIHADPRDLARCEVRSAGVTAPLTESVAASFGMKPQDARHALADRRVFNIR